MKVVLICLCLMSGALWAGVGDATSTGLVVSNSPMNGGAMVTMVATVSDTASVANAPVGMVYFYDGGKLLGKAQVSGGSATLVRPLAYGGYALTAEYVGATGFLASTSSVYALTLSPTAVTPVLSATFTSNTSNASNYDVAVSAVNPYGAAPQGSFSVSLGAQTLATIPSSSTSMASSLVVGKSLSVSRGASAAAVGDYDGDGYDEALLFDPNGPNYVYYSRDASGALAAKSTVTINNAKTYTNNATYFVAATSADFNHDGKLDVAVLNWNLFGGAYSTVEVLTGGGLSSGVWSFNECDELLLSNLAGESPTSIVAADFDGDGVADLAIGTASGNVYLYQGSGKCVSDGGRAFNFSKKIAVMSVVNGLAAANLVSDAVNDLVVVGSTGNNGQMALLLNNGAGVFTSKMQTLEAVPAGKTGVYSVVADYFLQGARPNLAVFSYLSGAAMYFTYDAPTAKIVAGQVLSLPSGSEAVTATSVDVDFDGWPEPVVLGGSLLQVDELVKDSSNNWSVTPNSTVGSSTFVAAGHFLTRLAQDIIVGNNGAPVTLQTLVNTQTLQGGATNFAVAGVGSQAVTVTFTPTDTTAFSSVSQNYSLQASTVDITSLNFSAAPSSPTMRDNVTLTVTAPYANGAAPPAGKITLATDVAMTQIVSVSATSYGMAQFTLGKLAVGAYTYYATFTPDSGTAYTYSGGAMSFTLTVGKATPVLNWPKPAAIAYGAALTATQLNATADVPGVFTYNHQIGDVLPSGDNLLHVDFVPTDTNNYTNASTSIFLTVGKLAPTITWTAPTAISYGTALSATQLNASSSTPGTFSYNHQIGEVLAVGSYVLHADFTPNDAVNYATASADVTLVVSKVAPAITWAQPAAIAYGTALSAAQLNATSSTAGVFAYNHKIGDILPPGSQTLHVDFTPTDTADYSNASADVLLVVGKGTPVITWAQPAAITYGTALSAVQLNATASTPGTFTYNHNAGEILPIGAQTLHVDFTPSDSSYNTASAEVTLTVGKGAPVITWAQPAAITYGAALSSAQLNATSTTPGVISYNYVAGAVLDAGSQTLTATLTPTDSTSYNTATANVSLTVNKAALTISADNATRAYGAANPTFTGSVSGAVNNDVIGESFSTTATSASNVGVYDITPTATGARAANYYVTATNGKLTLTKAESTTVLVSSDSSVILGVAATLTATVTPANGGTVTGYVNFYAGSALQESKAVSASGVATHTQNGLAEGSYQLTAVYVGDANVKTSTSAAVPFTVTSPTPTTTPDYSVSASPSSLTLRAGSSGSATITLTPTGNYMGTVSLSCSSLPNYVTCAFSPAVLTTTGDNKAVTSTLTISTSTVLTASSRHGQDEGRMWTRLTPAFVLGFVGICAVWRRRGLRWAMLAVFAVVMMTLSGCGGGSASPTAQTKTYNTPAGSYTMVVTAGAGNGARTTHNMNFSLIVTN